MFVTVSSYYFQGVILKNQTEVTSWLSSFGPYVILAYVLAQTIAILFPPLGGFVLVIAMVALFGPGVALLLAYLVTTPVYILNFYFARRFGRPLVTRVVGKEALNRVDHYIKDAGTSLLIILRLLMGGSFDYLSYGFGLTKVSFKTFIVVNIVAGIPGTLLHYFILREFSSLTVAVLVFYGVTIILAGISIYIAHILKNHKSGKN